jgi:hypothetical protein
MKPKLKKILGLALLLCIVVAAGLIFALRSHRVVVRSPQYGFAIEFPKDCDQKPLGRPRMAKQADGSTRAIWLTGPVRTEFARAPRLFVFVQEPFVVNPEPKEGIAESLAEAGLMGLAVLESIKNRGLMVAPEQKLHHYLVDRVYPAISVLYEMEPPMTVWGRSDFVFAKSRLYVIGFEGLPGKEHLNTPEVNRFFSSFHIDK